MFCPKPPLYLSCTDRWDRPRPPRPRPIPSTALDSRRKQDRDKGYTAATVTRATGTIARENDIGRFSISPGQTGTGKNLVVLLAFCLIILAVIIPVTGATGGSLTGAGNDGTVTITRLAQVKYYIWEDTVTFSGTNTGSGTTYLFITGPNLKTNGSQIQSIYPGQSPVIDEDASTFLAARVGPDNTWSYTWDTHNVMIDSGTYTVYAASTPRDLPHINSTYFDRISFIMARPRGTVPPADTVTSTGAATTASGTTTRPESGTCSSGTTLTQPSVVTHGNTITISGCAGGTPGPGVAIWVIGPKVPGAASYADQVIVRPDSTGFYSRDIDSATASRLGGTYHVVVQHPGKNNILDISVDTAEGATNGWVLNRMLKDHNNAGGTRVFKIHGAGSLQGDDAYEALIQGYKESVITSGVDDIIAVVPSSGVTAVSTQAVTVAQGDSNAPITITRPKSGRYSIGDTLTFSGTNNLSGTTYLFITGPNLDPKGAQIQSTHPGKSPVTDGDASTFQAAVVGPDNQWSYTWNSQKALIDAGVFTVYAAGSPRDLPHINNTQYAKIALFMMRPANIESWNGSLSLPPSVVMKGDTITISGTAQGNSGPGVAIWIIGAPASGTVGYADQVIVHPDSTGSYSLNLDRATARLEEGKFHVVVQHPMQNNVFDIYLANNTAGNAADAWVLNRMLKDSSNADGTRVFKIRGAGSLQGDDAYLALVQVFEDKTVDDNIVIFPSTVNSPGSGDTGPVLQDLVPTTQYVVTGGERGNPAGSGNLLDQVLGFLSGMF